MSVDSFGGHRPPPLQTYSAPSGPKALPVGDPPSVANTEEVPSGSILVTQFLASSTMKRLPFLSNDGPSGNRKPLLKMSSGMAYSLLWPTLPVVLSREGKYRDRSAK